MEEDSVNYRPVSLWETGDVISWMRGGCFSWKVVGRKTRCSL